MKKVLSFVLSVAMVICLMPAMAFAADDTTTTTATATGLSQFSDADSIQKKEAVAVLVGLGVIDGMGDGTFQPQGDLTRAQASKLVATVVKSGDKSEIPAPSEDPFTDVAKDYWGAGAIKFGVDNSYINGMGDGTFHPEDQVTTAQLATMLEKLLGYSVADVNYQWPENAMAYATGAGLLEDVKKGANEALNREEAAQMIFNALRANDVVKATVTGGNGVEGFTDYDPVTNNKADYRNPAEEANPNIEQLVEKYFPKATENTESSDAFGRPATVWKNGREKVTDEVVKEPVLCYTAQEVSTEKPLEKASDKLYADLDGYIANGATVIYNGEELPEDLNRDDSDALAEYVAAITGNGVLVELYANDKDTEITDIIVIDYIVDQVKKVDSKTGKITLTDNGEIDKKAKFYSAVSSVVKDDYVLVAVSEGEIVDAYLPTAVADSAVTRITNPSKEGVEDAKATAGGTEYTIGTNGVAGDGLVINADDAGTVYLDQYGYLVAYAKADDSEAASWALLKSVYTADSNNEVGETSTDYQAIIVKEDGTTETIDLMYIDDPDDDNYDAAAPTVALINDFCTDRTTENRGNNWYSETGLLVTYEEAAAGYKLGADDGTKSDGVDEPLEGIDKKTTKINGMYLSNDLNVITVSGKKASTMKVSTASSITKTVAANSYKYVWKKIGNNTLVTAVYITGEASDTTTLKVSKVLGTTTYSGTKKGTEIEYYTADSEEAQTGIVSNTEVEPGWFSVKEIKEGMTINPTQDKVVIAAIEPQSGDTAYGSSMTIGPDTYVLAPDATVVDLAESDITTVEALVEQIAKTGAKADTDTLYISFSWKMVDDDMTVSQVYIDEVVAPAEEPVDEVMG